MTPIGPLSRLVSRRLGWTPRHALDVRRGLRVPMPDGVELRTDVYAPRGLGRGPTLLIRSPCGRQPFGLSMAAPFAAQGYFAVVQSCRGTAGSGCFSSAPLAEDLELIGVPAAQLHVSSSAGSADFFVRLCDVDGSGVSRNVCDGLQRVASRSDRDPQPVRVELWPTAYRVRRGHRLRVQVSSGGFPRWARNPGSREPLATATSLRAAEQSIHHSPDHPSALVLPSCPVGAGRPAR